MCLDTVRKKPYSLQFVPDHIKTREMCADALRKKPNLLHFVPYHLRIQEMYEAPVEKKSLLAEICHRPLKNPRYM